MDKHVQESRSASMTSHVDEVGLEDIIKSDDSDPEQDIQDPLEMHSEETFSAPLSDIQSSMVEEMEIPNRDKQKGLEVDGLKTFVYPVFLCDYSKSKSTPWCVVCGNLLKSMDRKCLDMFETNMKFGNMCTYSESLAYAIRFNIVPEDAPSKSICCQCCLKLEESIKIEMRLKEIRSGLNKLFSKTVQSLVMGTLSSVWMKNDQESTAEAVSVNSSAGNGSSESVSSAAHEDSESSAPFKIRIMDPASINKSVPNSKTIPIDENGQIKFNKQFMKVPVNDMEKILGRKITPKLVQIHPKQAMPSINLQKGNTAPEKDVDPLALSNLLTEINQYDPQKPEPSVNITTKRIVYTTKPVATTTKLPIPPLTRIVSKSAMPPKTVARPMIIKTSTGGMKIMITPSKVERRIVPLVLPAASTNQNSSSPLILSSSSAKPQSSSCSIPDAPQKKIVQQSKPSESHKQRRKSQHVVRDDIFKLHAKKKPMIDKKAVKHHQDDSNDQESRPLAKKQKRLERLPDKRDLHSVLESVKADNGDIGTEVYGSGRPRRSAFQKASKRLEIIATYDKSPARWNSKNSLVPEIETEEKHDDDNDDEKGPSKKIFKLMEARVVLKKMEELKSNDEKNGSVTKDVNVNSGLEETCETVESVCSQIEQVVLESPTEASKRKDSLLKKGTETKKSNGELFVCDMCKLDFLKLDELRNHIEQDHFSPFY